MENMFLCCTSLNVKPAFYIKHSLIKSDKNNSYSDYFNKILKKVDKLEEENKILKNQIENTPADNVNNININNEISIETLLKLNEQNKELLKETVVSSEDIKVSNIKFNNKDNKEVKTSNHKQKN
jgi:uncharacterized membrane protein